MAQTISTKYAAQLANGTRWSRGYIYIIDDAATIYDNTHLIEYKIQTQLQSDKNIFGNSVCKYATVKLQNPDNSTYNNLIGKRLNIYAGLTLDIGLPTESVEYLHQGVFRILDIKADKDNETLTLECYDAMVRFNVPYVEAGTYPMTLSAFVQMLAASVGLELGNTTFNNSTLSITEQPNVAASEYQTRALLNWAAELAGGNAIMGIDNKLYIKGYGAVSAFTITPQLYFNNKLSSLFGPINGIAMVREALGDVVYYPDPLPSNGITYRIVDNMLNYNGRAAMIDDVYNIVNGTQYYPFELSWRGTGHLEFMDKITITDSNAATYNTYIMNSVLTFNGALSEELSAFAYTPAATSVKNPGQVAARTKLTEARVDKVEGEITLIAADIDGLESSMAQLVIDSQTITATVAQTNNNLNTLSTQVQQTASSLTTTITDVNDIKSYYQFTADSLTIGKTSSPAQIKIGIIDNKATMTLTDGTANTATIQSDTMFINNVEIVNTLEVGNHKVQKLTGSTTRTIWLPLG